MDLRLVFFIMRKDPSSESGDAASDGLFEETGRAGVDCNAKAAPSFWCNIEVIKDRREARFSGVLTRWKKFLLLILALSLSLSLLSESS